MIKHGLLLASAAVFALASPLGAQQITQPTPAEEPALAVLNQLAGAPSDAARLVLFDRALTLLPQPTPLRGHVLCGRAALLSGLHREDEARAGFDQCLQLLPDDPDVLLGIASYQTIQKRPVDAAQLIIRAARLKAPGVDHIDTDVMASLLRQLTYAGKSDLGDTMIDAWSQRAIHATIPGSFLTMCGPRSCTA